MGQMINNILVKLAMIRILRKKIQKMLLTFYIFYKKNIDRKKYKIKINILNLHKMKLNKIKILTKTSMNAKKTIFKIKLECYKTYKKPIKK